MIDEIKNYASNGIASYETLWGELNYVQQNPTENVQEFAGKIQNTVRKIKNLKLEENPPAEELKKFEERLNKHATDNFIHSTR